MKWYGNSNFCLVFKGSCLKLKKHATYTPPNTIFFFIIYELDTWSRDLNSDFTSKDCLLGDFKLAKLLIRINTYVMAMVLDLIRF